MARSVDDAMKTDDRDGYKSNSMGQSAGIGSMKMAINNLEISSKVLPEPLAYRRPISFALKECLAISEPEPFPVPAMDPSAANPQ
jgi:hypothetical protein